MDASEGDRPSSPRASPRRFALVIPNATVFVAGLCVMVAELVAGRLVAQHLGASVYTWTSCIGVFLGGISLGNYLGGRVADRYAARPALSALFIVASLTCLLVPIFDTLLAQWTWLWDFSWPTRIFLHVTGTFATPAVLLGTVSPVVAKMALAEGRSTGRTIGQVYAWGAMGSIVGTYLTGFYLIAHIGTLATLLAMSALLAVMGVLYGLHRWLPRLWLLLCLAAGWAAFAKGGVMEAAALVVGLRERPHPAVVFDDESAYVHIWVSTVDGNPNLRTLTLNRLTHSIMDLQQPTVMKYDYAQLYEGVMDTFAPPDRPVRTLMLGGGGYAFPRYLELTRTNATIDVAEIDPGVTRAAQVALGLPTNTSIRIHHADARTYVSDLVRQKEAGRAVPAYDLIFGDAFESTAVPFHLTTVEFDRQLSQLLAPDGVYLLNCIDVLKSGRFLASLIRTCREVFPQVYVFACGGTADTRSTYVLVCSRRALDFAAVIDRVKRKYQVAGQQWPADQVEQWRQREDALTLTDDFVPVESMLMVEARLRTGQVVGDLLEAGAEAAREGRKDRAEKYFRRALARDPGNRRAYYNLGFLMNERGHPEEALTLLAHARPLDPGFSPARDLATHILVGERRVDEAVELWEEILRRGDDNIAAHMNLGELYAHQGRSADAIAQWEQASLLAPGDASLHYKIGLACMTAGRQIEAAQHFEMAILAAPEFAQAYNNLGVVMVRQGNLERASYLFKEALRHNPEFVEARGNLEALSAAAPAAVR